MCKASRGTKGKGVCSATNDLQARPSYEAVLTDLAQLWESRSVPGPA